MLVGEVTVATTEDRTPSWREVFQQIFHAVIDHNNVEDLLLAGAQEKLLKAQGGAETHWLKVK
jgi:hypothetical protein